MANRIKDMRWALRNNLEELGSKLNWEHITNQRGMFAYTGMTEAQVLQIRADHHVYMTNDGRISIAGINTHNVHYIAKSIHAVTN
jgi:aspartate/tyrosine/aromatic aminotransferase